MHHNNMLPNLVTTSTGSYRLMLVRVLTVQILLMDNEFEKVQDLVPMLNFNTTTADEHVGKIECHIWVNKEWACGIVCTLPYPHLPRQMRVHLLPFVVMWLNNFPVVNGISADFSPQELILWHCLTYKHHCCAAFGAYCETHEDNKLATNSMCS
jgi:hypothetical protein